MMDCDLSFPMEGAVFYRNFVHSLMNFWLAFIYTIEIDFDCKYLLIGVKAYL